MLSLQRVIDVAEGGQSISTGKQLNNFNVTNTRSTIRSDCSLHPGGQKILGVYWDVPSDCFLFNINDLAIVAAIIHRTNQEKNWFSSMTH